MQNKWRVIERLKSIGISESDALALRRISMTLQRWYEMECGTDRSAIERDEISDIPYRVFSYSKTRYSVRDLERGAEKRLAKIMKQYKKLRAYLQTDPRGASLYILRSGDVPKGKDVDSYYNNGIAVYK